MPGLTLGRPLTDIAGDTVLDVDVKPNRGDALSLIGLAREVAAITGTKVRWPEITVPESGDSTNDHVWVEVADRRLCPRFVGRYVDQLKIGPSPLSVQLRLAAAGMRPISNAVDASNYVMLELGKPIHVFDAAAVTGGMIVVRPARDGERIETLDHVERTLTPDTLVIADSQGAIGIAGVMGGADSEVSESTTAAIIESAIFDPVSIRRTAQRYALRSEASARFEKGQESRLARLGADRTAQLLAEWAGARVAVGVIDTDPGRRASAASCLSAGARQPSARRGDRRRTRLARRWSGSRSQSKRSLPRIGLVIAEGDTESADGALVAVVPPHRRDIAIEADVAEEICRVRGYDTVPSLVPRHGDAQLPARSAPRDRFDARHARRPRPVRGRHPRAARAGRSRTARLRRGRSGPRSGSRTRSLPTTPSCVARSCPACWPCSAATNGSAARTWPSSRSAPSTSSSTARRGRPRCSASPWPERGAPRRGSSRLAPRRSTTSRASSSGLPRDSTSAAPSIGRHRCAPASTTPGVPPRCIAEVDGLRVDLGRVGEIDPRLLAAYEIRAERVPFALLDMSALERLSTSTVEVRRLDHLPILERDIAVVVSRDVAAAEVERVVRANAGSFLSDVTLFDRYTGAPLGQDEVSLAFRLRYQPIDEPLSDQAVDGSVEQVSKALAAEVGGRIRDGG